jgi:hypothetical protein
MVQNQDVDPSSGLKQWRGTAMGAWGVLAFDNDSANDWAYGLDEAHNLAPVEEAFSEVESAQAGYLEIDAASAALAACEVLARLQGRPGYTNAYTEKVDRWVAVHPLAVPPSLINRGSAAIDRILDENSELRDSWEEADSGAWLAGVADLRTRLG